MENIKNLILNSTENDNIDFKKEWYLPKNRIDLIHDIICLSNSISNNDERYIVIGVKENSKTKEKKFFDISDDVNALKSEDIIQYLRNCLSTPPRIECYRLEINTKNIDVITIIPKCRDLPYVINQSYSPKNSKKKLHKNFIYSRNSGQNTPIDETCEKEIVKELFARQRGDHLSAIQRFKLYLNDVKNWKRANSESIDNYYYLKNYKFKIIRNSANDNVRYLKKTDNYKILAADTCLCKDYWEHYDITYDDYYNWFDIELWAENTLIKTCTIMEIFSKYYFTEKGAHNNTYYTPLRDELSCNNIGNKEDIEKSFLWGICKVLYKNDLPADIKFSETECSEILKFLNYDFLQNPHVYTQKNIDWIYKSPTEK